MKIGQHTFDFEHQGYIMGILNVTPDSFSDGGQWVQQDQALAHVEAMIAEGCDILDIGGESTRPGHQQISVAEECARILPIIEAVKARFDLPISVDCYRAETARAAIDAGCDMINDIWGLKYDEAMAGLIAETGVAYCLMHNDEAPRYESYPQAVWDDILRQVDRALAAGCRRDQLILDPGIGFAKTRPQDAQAVHHLDDLAAFGYPVLLGTSRKRLLGSIVDLPAQERDLATAATTVYGYLKGARIFRVHNVKVNKEALAVAMALENDGHGLS